MKGNQHYIFDLHKGHYPCFDVFDMNTLKECYVIDSNHGFDSVISLAESRGKTIKTGRIRCLDLQSTPKDLFDTSKESFD